MKLLEVACLNHTNSTKHKLKDYTMMKNFMTSGALSKGKKPDGDTCRKSATPNPGHGDHDNLRLTPPTTRGCYMTT
jgi:hypothetical protein